MTRTSCAPEISTWAASRCDQTSRSDTAAYSRRRHALRRQYIRLPPTDMNGGSIRRDTLRVGVPGPEKREERPTIDPNLTCASRSAASAAVAAPQWTAQLPAPGHDAFPPWLRFPRGGAGPPGRRPTGNGHRARQAAPSHLAPRGLPAAPAAHHFFDLHERPVRHPGRGHHAPF